MATKGESSLLDYSLEREGGHDEPLNSANLDEDPALSPRGEQKIRFKVLPALQGLHSGPTSSRKSQSTLIDLIGLSQRNTGLEETASVASTRKASLRE